MLHFKNKLTFLTFFVFLGNVSSVSATKLRIHIQNADPSENLKTKVIETMEGRIIGKKVNIFSVIEGSNKRGLLLDLSEKSVKGDLQQLEFVFPGPEKGQKESLLVTFSKEFLETAGKESTTKVRVKKIKQDHDLIQEFSYMPTKDKACPAGSENWKTHHHLHLKILPKKKDVEITNSHTENCE